jgi:hypothetical protein
VVGSCEHGNKPWGSVKGGAQLHRVRAYLQELRLETFFFV